MTHRGIWEERMWSSNAPLPKRDMTTGHPMYGLPPALRFYIADGLVLQPWHAHALAPIPSEWQPLGADHEAVYLVRDQKVRVGLVDYSEGTVVAWRRTAGSTPYQTAKPRAARDADAPAADPISRPRRSRTRTRRRRPEATDSPPPSRKPTT